MSFRGDDRTTDNGEPLSDSFRSNASAGTSPTQSISLSEKARILAEARAILEEDFKTASARDDVPSMREARSALEAVGKSIESLKEVIDQELFPHDIATIRGMYAQIDHPEAPGIGRALLERLDEAGCKTVIEPTFTDDPNSLTAEYVSYSYKKGFRNQIGVNRFRLKDRNTGLLDALSLFDSLTHEGSHGLQKFAAPALHLSPFNRDTRAIIHPLDWIQLEGLCERDAFAEQGLFNYLLNKTNPAVRERSVWDVVSVDDFEKALARYPRLHNALIHVALNALHKPKIVGDNSFSFTHHYQGVALKNYRAGMVLRTEHGEMNHVFVRLEPQDFYAVGDYGVGPNALGIGKIDEEFLHRHELKPKDSEDLASLCSEYGIPPLEECPTLGEYNKALAQQRMQPAQEQRSGGGFALAAAPC